MEVPAPPSPPPGGGGRVRAAVGARVARAGAGAGAGPALLLRGPGAAEGGFSASAAGQACEAGQGLGAAVARATAPRAGAGASAAAVAGRLLGEVCEQWRAQGWLPRDGRARTNRDGAAMVLPAEFVALVAARRGPPVPALLVLECAERLRGEAHARLLNTLLRLEELAGEEAETDVVVVLVSTLGWESLRHAGLTGTDPEEVLLDAPTPRELQDRLIAERPVEPHPEAWDGFVRALVPALRHTTTSVHDAWVLAEELFPVYCRPVGEGRAAATDAQALYAACSGAFKEVLQVFNREGVFGILKRRQALEGQGPGKRKAAAAQRQQAHLQIPYFSKLLLLAAFLASSNPSGADNRLFSEGGRKRRRKNVHAVDRAADAALEAKLLGPGTFTLERLMAIFSCLVRNEWQTEEDEWLHIERGAHSVETYTQVRNLVALRLLSQSGGDLLEGARYRCNAPEAVARELARSLGVDLQAYLLYV